MGKKALGKNFPVKLMGSPLLPKSARRPALIKKACRLAVLGEGRSLSGEINVIFATRSRMLFLNKRFLKHDHDTDVISFEYSGKRPGDTIGDVVISVFQARRQARELGHELLEEILTLTLHGTLHLLGYEDRTTSQKTAMFRKQDRLLRRLMGHKHGT